MTSAEAQTMLEAAKAKAREMGKAVTIVVLDVAAVPVALERVDDAPRMTAVIAEGKAAGSVLTGRDSGKLKAMEDSYPSAVSTLSAKLGGRFVAAAGAVALRRDAEVIGAIGVSGAAADEDEEIARAGAEAAGL